ncbi:DUF1993 domain-containing protein [Limobrevibacterium gyesilva]|uniref:DUF1993 domain-containing protein n=1 Tax=Limobrevibacterium gyesilva TaxID=2991712 RepID=A0AA41YQQ4_9PROT|nr:DUF1993 domain-containing protein [Limobrevibacterium gyesilva]MCW3476981.1 DUF1993 domain-containing protein [Limobrevibacterium gyesilva]
MAISMYSASVPMFKTLLGALSAVLDKGAAFAEAKKFDSSVLVNARLAPDMFPLSKQVQIATDMVKGGAARLAGVEIPVYADDEATIDELKARIAKTVAFLDTLSAGQIDGTEGKEIVLKMRAGDTTFTGQRYLIGFVIPNVIFHCATAYDILRHNGVDVGKRDFLGAY